MLPNVPRAETLTWIETTEITRAPAPLAPDLSGPKVSIVIPNLNGAEFLEDCLRSVLLQDYQNLEIIVIDGGSTDGSLRIIEKYRPWFSHCYTGKDDGQSNAINRGLELVTGKYWNWVNCDEVLLDGAITLLTHQLEQAGDDVVFCCGANAVWHPPDYQGEVRIQDENFIDGRINLVRSFTNLKAGLQPGCLMRVDIARKVGGVSERHFYANDVDLHLRMLTQGSALHVPRTTLAANLHARQLSIMVRPGNFGERFLTVESIYRLLPPNHPLQVWRPMSMASASHFASTKSFESRRWLRSLWYYGGVWCFLFQGWMRGLPRPERVCLNWFRFQHPRKIPTREKP